MLAHTKQFKRFGLIWISLDVNDKICLNKRINTRSFINSDEILKILSTNYPSKKKDIIEFAYEGKTIFEQARLVAECLLIIHPHGGGMTNMMFIHPNTTVIEVFPFAYNPVYYFSDLVLSAGGRYKSLITPQNLTILNNNMKICNIFSSSIIDPSTCMKNWTCFLCYKDGNIIVESKKLQNYLDLIVM